MTEPIHVRGPYFDELTVGDVFDGAAPLTITDGLAATHHAILGNRLRLALDRELSERVTGLPGLVSPALAWDISVGQSTEVTQKVRANLFYRNLRFHRLPHVGDTLRTITTVDALRANADRPGREPTGMVALHIVTTDQEGRTVLDYWRCAMLPVASTPIGDLPHDDLTSIGDVGVVRPAPDAAVVGWDLDAYRASLPHRDRSSPPVVGQVWEVDGGDVVSSAPELARLTGNLASVHHDAGRAGGRRLVYGGHTVGVALHHLSRALPSMLTVLGWHSCDHLAPVHEDDTLVSSIEVTGASAVGDATMLDVRVTTCLDDEGEGHPVLDWHLTVALP